MAQYSSAAASTAVAGPRPLARCLSAAAASPGSRAIMGSGGENLLGRRVGPGGAVLQRDGDRLEDAPDQLT